MTRQLEVWEGEFGRTYTDRNIIDWHVRLPLFQEMLGDLPIKSVLEVGCNRGHNLVALSEMLNSPIIGVEPNQHALELAKASSPNVLRGYISDLPFKDCCFDLAFTAGVLIHIPLASLSKALAEIYRVSRRYILAIEYYARKETPVRYRGHNNLLWKRDFPKLYQEQFPGLELTCSGYWAIRGAFYRTHWWLFKKPIDK